MKTTGSSNDSLVPLEDIAAILRTVRAHVEENEGSISFPAGETIVECLTWRCEINQASRI